MKQVVRFFVFCVFAQVLMSWGVTGHSIINRRSVLSFPASMAGFEVWADSLSMHASDADNRKSADPNESRRHYIDLDNYAEFLTKGRIASTYDSILALHSSSFVLQNGTLPWATRVAYDSLRNAFRSCRWHKAMLFASDLGHYVGDGHMPLHLTANYDGQNTGQSGVHYRYESGMVDLFQTSLNSYAGTDILPVTNVDLFIQRYVCRNEMYVDSVLKADAAAVLKNGGYSSYQYQVDLFNKTAFTDDLFSAASHTLATLIYAAWTEAGSPRFGMKNPVLEPAADKIRIFPIPCKESLTISGVVVQNAYLCDENGRRLLAFKAQQCSLRGIPNGVYFLKIYTQGTIIHKKIIIEN